MSQNDQLKNVSGEGEKANVPQEPTERAPQIQEVRNPEPDQQVAQQQQPVTPSNTTPWRPTMMWQDQGTTFFYPGNSVPPPQLISHGYVPNAQLTVPPPQFPSQQYAQPGQVFNPQYAQLGETPNPQYAQLGQVFNPQFGAPGNAASWPGYDKQYAGPGRHSTSQQRSKRVNVPPYSRPTLTNQRRGSVRGLTRSQHCASGKYQIPDVIYKIVPVDTVVLNGPMNVETACFHHTLPKEGKSQSIQITNPIEMFSVPDNPNNKVMSNPTIVNGPVNIKHLHFCDMKSQKCIEFGHVDLNAHSFSQDTVIHHSDATTNTSSDVNDVSCQTNAAREDTQEQDQQKSIDDRRVRDETPTQITFAEKVTSKPNVPVVESSVNQPVRLEAAAELRKDRETALKVKKVAPKAILKPEKLPVKKAPVSFKWNPIPSNLQAVLAQDWTQVGSSTSDDRAPSCSTAPVNNPWVEYLTAKEQSVDKCDPHVKGHADLRSPKPKDTEVSSDSENVPLEVKIDDDKVEDDKVDNVAKPELPTVAQKKAQEKAEFEEALATTLVKDQLTESCKAYIKAHHFIRQDLHRVRAVSADIVETDKYQKWLLEFFTSKPKAYWEENHIMTLAKDCIKKLKTSHGQNTPKDKDVRLKCDCLLENMHEVIVQDISCINETHRENALKEIENKYLDAVFNMTRNRPKLINFRDKLNLETRKLLDGPAWTSKALQGYLDAYVKRQRTVRALPIGSNVQYKNDMEQYLHLQYSINKPIFDRKLAEDREGLIANYLKFWRWQQKVVIDSLPTFQNLEVAISLMISDLMTKCNLEGSTIPNNLTDVLLFDAKALEAKYSNYYSIKTPFEVTEHTSTYTSLVFAITVSARQRKSVKGVQAPVKGGQASAGDDQAPVEGGQASAGDDQMPVENDQAPVKDDQASAGDDQAPVEGGQASAGDDQMPVENDQAPVKDDQASAGKGKAPVENGQVPAENGQAPADE